MLPQSNISHYTVPFSQWVLKFLLLPVKRPTALKRPSIVWVSFFLSFLCNVLQAAAGGCDLMQRLFEPFAAQEMS